jgi:hypothetical protein
MGSPNNKTQLSYVRLTPADYRQAKRIADVTGLALSTWLRTVIRERLEKERGK